MAAPVEKEEAVLRAVEELAVADDYLDSSNLSSKLSVAHATLVDGVLKSLLARAAIRLETVTHERWQVAAEGLSYADAGSPEQRLHSFVVTCVEEGSAATFEKVDQALGKQVAARGRQQALKKRWVAIQKADKVFVPVEGADVVDDVAEALRTLRDQGGNPEGLQSDILKQLKSRKLAALKPYKTYKIFKGERLADARRVQATELTRTMLETDEWKDISFKGYNFKAEGKPTNGGCLHTLLKVREQFRLIFLEMGFEEMPTNNYVESSFWNFDALFQPQQHPARDEHDTFFLSDPELANVLDRDYLERVRRTHEEGGFGSRGYRYEWSEQEARKNILRTHTTAVSSRMLYLLAQETEFKPRKYFSIDRVFRNETLDATHLAEFHQIEGLVADRNLSLGDLKGIIHEFFKKMGMSRLRFKPTHNPYTTPSLEIHSYHEGLGKWVEVGNSGVFRPEMIRPMGIPEDVTVIAWGLSLERPTMIRYGIDNIRDLFGHRVDLKAIQTNPLCRLTF
ncbi:phenylalanyl-tRNA synthetase alpha chain [Chondrus crispus]|uniref:phenylalanine--tRNA ligase n=1 Tax=Chondrus crispus TaxID=2769 RepID=R7QP70_CHOCR|nr:phenylalanyl-tRNA synthetase alpha chain [Chondrus crispus]CDF39558.1 phenylalanyl-tRNA synthetase alpha chain [Chondrus crispus]|eukprot:XP_005709852.1 phenylalanyl-tRNA synthetase alpha chain [Chondrus crispus]